MESVKIGSMTQASFHFARAHAFKRLWHVRQSGPAGRYLGMVAEERGGYRATRITTGPLPTEWFQERDAAAAWLVKLTSDQQMPAAGSLPDPPKIRWLALLATCLLIMALQWGWIILFIYVQM
jgi:hypothetical protein